MMKHEIGIGTFFFLSDADRADRRAPYIARYIKTLWLKRVSLSDEKWEYK